MWPPPGQEKEGRKPREPPPKLLGWNQGEGSQGKMRAISRRMGESRNFQWKQKIATIESFFLLQILILKLLHICLRFNHSVPLTFVFLKITNIFPLLAISQLLSYYSPSIFDPFIFPQMAKRLIPLHSTSWSVTFTLPCLSQSWSQEELSDKCHSPCISQVLECPSLPHLCLQPWTLRLVLYGPSPLGNISHLVSFSSPTSTYNWCAHYIDLYCCNSQALDRVPEERCQFLQFVSAAVSPWSIALQAFIDSEFTLTIPFLGFISALYISALLFKVFLILISVKYFLIHAIS